MSRSARSLATFTVALALGFSPAAWAGTVTITPLLGVGLNEKQLAGLKQLMASELEFMPELSGVVENPSGPPAAACLVTTSCLSGLVKATDQLITGTAALSGANFTLDLLLYDKATNKIVRKKHAVVPTDPTQLANQITAVLREVITGQGQKEEAAAAAAPASFEEADDAGFAPGAAMAPAGADPENLSFDDLEDLTADPPAAPVGAAAAAAAQAQAARAAEAARAAAAAEAARQAAAAEAARKAAAVAQAAAAEAARLAAAAEVARVAAAAAEAARVAEASRIAKEAAARAAIPLPAPLKAAVGAVVDEGLINFGSGVDQMSAEDIDQLIQFGPAGAAAAAPPVAPRPMPIPMPGLSAAEELALAADLAAKVPSAAVADLDTPTPKATRVAAPKPAPETARVERDVAENLQISLRGGYASYNPLAFVAVGGEVGIPVHEGLHVIGGIQVWAVQRVLPTEIAVQQLKTIDWDTIFPFNFGLMYKFPLGVAQPYVGADAIFAQYYNLPPETDWAIGGRGRVGCDFMFVDSFGLNANVALGGWAGKRWPEIQEGMKNSGFLPEFSAGTVFAF